MARPKKDRLSNRNYYSEILATKQTEKITYSKIASWMDLTESNLRTMIYLKLNPTAKEWHLFKSGLKNYIENKNGRISTISTISTIVCPIHKIVHLGNCKLTFEQKIQFADIKQEDKTKLLSIYESLSLISKFKKLRDTSSGDPTNNSPA